MAVQTTGGSALTNASSFYAQTIRGLGIKRNQDTPPSTTFDKLGNFTSLSKADVSVPRPRSGAAGVQTNTGDALRR